MQIVYQKFLIVVTFTIAIFTMCLATKRSKKLHKTMLLRRKETNAIDFIRLVVMRLIYGVATRVGMGENISEALDGAFVPPGVEDEDYGFDGSDGEDFDY